MIKSLTVFLLIFFAGFLSACSSEPQEAEFSFELVYAPDAESSQKMWPDINLRNSFVTYWDARFIPDLNRTWEIEAPHLRFMGSKDIYIDFFSRGAGQILKEIVISRVDKVHENMYKVECELKLIRLGRERNLHLIDSWIRVGGHWYHLERNPLVFSFMGLS